MEQVKPKRGTRVREVARQMNVHLNNFKDFLNSKLDFVFPKDYAQFTSQKKQQFWKNQLQILKNQKSKICYLFPDNRPQDQMKLAIQILKKNNEDRSLDYEYEPLFLGNKKQLLIYLKCVQMDGYLQKYKLPKQYEVLIKEVQKTSQLLYELKIRRNIHISKQQKDKAVQITKQIKSQQEKFQKEYTKFQKLIQSIFQHFKSQEKRTKLTLTAIRYTIFQRVRLLGDKHELYVHQKFPDIQNDEFLDVQITKKSQLDNYFDKQFDLNKQSQQQIIDDDKSSVVSSLSEQQLNLIQTQILKKKNSEKIKPPVGIYSIQFQKYQNKTVYLKITLQHTRNKVLLPIMIQFSEKYVENYAKLIDVQHPQKDIIVALPFDNPFNHINYFFRTKNQCGTSSVKNFQYLLRLDKTKNLLKNSKFICFGQSKVVIPQNKSKKIGEFTEVCLSTADFSISEMNTLICDDEGNSADWGLTLRKEDDKQNQYIQKNDYFSIPNISKNRIYQEPALRLDKNHSIVKVSSGRNYGMLLSSYGIVWVYGKNYCGQLGIKQDLENQDQTVELRFFKQNKIFITDIKASQCSSSFAIDSTGKLYKWGANQFLSTQHPIYDRFGMVLNYSTADTIQQQWTPLIVKKHFDSERIVQVQCGNQFYYMLNNEGTLYGWGQVRNLGKGLLKDGEDNQIQNICIQIEIMEYVQQVSAGRDHTLVLTKEGKIYGWGNLGYLSNICKEFSYIPVDLSQQYGIVSSQDKIKCGPTYSCLYSKKDKKIQLFGELSKFKKTQVEIENEIRKMQCQDGIIALLIQSKN